MLTLKRTQKGIALITALLAVSLATIVAVNMTERQQYDIRRAANQLQQQQAMYYALGGEQWARGLLKRDYDHDKKNKWVDSLNEDWAQELPQTAVEGGFVAGKIEDLQGKFNLNNLYLDAQASEADAQLQKAQVEMFQRLLKVLEIDEPIAQAIIDWVDPDSDITFPNGAEDAAYQNKTPPYHTANQRMASPSELLLVEGVTPEIYEKLLPFVCTLPGPSVVNVNTAPAEVIAALSSQLDLQKAQNIIDDNNTGFEEFKDFLDVAKPYVTNLTQFEQTTRPLTGVNSRYFLLHADVQVDRITQQLFSVLERGQNGYVRVVSRSPGVE